jgi:hypothetical protein
VLLLLLNNLDLSHSFPKNQSKHLCTQKRNKIISNFFSRNIHIPWN